MSLPDIENSPFLLLLFRCIEVSIIERAFSRRFTDGCRLLEERGIDVSVCNHGDGGSWKARVRGAMQLRFKYAVLAGS